MNGSSSRQYVVILALLLLVLGSTVGAAAKSPLIVASELAVLGLSDLEAGREVVRVNYDDDRLGTEDTFWVVGTFEVRLEWSNPNYQHLNLDIDRTRFSIGPIKRLRDEGGALKDYPGVFSISNGDVKIDLDNTDESKRIDTSGLEEKLERLEEYLDSSEAEVYGIDDLDLPEGIDDVSNLIDAVLSEPPPRFMPSFDVYLSLEIRAGTEDGRLVDSDAASFHNWATPPGPIGVARPVGDIDELEPEFVWEIPALPAHISHVTNELIIEDITSRSPERIWRGVIQINRPGNPVEGYPGLVAYGDVGRVSFSPYQPGRYSDPNGTVYLKESGGQMPQLQVGHIYRQRNIMRDPEGEVIGIGADEFGETAEFTLAAEPLVIVQPELGEEITDLQPTLEWENDNPAGIVAQIDSYRLDLYRDNSLLKGVTVGGATNYSVQQHLTPGSYTWVVTPVVKGTPLEALAAEGEFSIPAFPDASDLIASPEPGIYWVDEALELAVNEDALDPWPIDELKFSWQARPAINGLNTVGASGEVTLGKAGGYELRLTVSHQQSPNLKLTTDWVAIEVQKRLAIVDLSVDQDSFLVGEPITGSFTVMGGQPPYTVTIGDDEPFEVQTEGVITFQTGGAAESGSLQVTVTDSTETDDPPTATAEVDFEVREPSIEIYVARGGAPDQTQFAAASNKTVTFGVKVEGEPYRQEDGPYSVQWTGAGSSFADTLQVGLVDEGDYSVTATLAWGDQTFTSTYEYTVSSVGITIDVGDVDDEVLLGEEWSVTPEIGVEGSLDESTVRVALNVVGPGGTDTIDATFSGSDLGSNGSVSVPFTWVPGVDGEYEWWLEASVQTADESQANAESPRYTLQVTTPAISELALEVGGSSVEALGLSDAFRAVAPTDPDPVSEGLAGYTWRWQILQGGAEMASVETSTSSWQASCGELGLEPGGYSLRVTLVYEGEVEVDSAHMDFQVDELAVNTWVLLSDPRGASLVGQPVEIDVGYPPLPVGFTYDRIDLVCRGNGAEVLVGSIGAQLLEANSELIRFYIDHAGVIGQPGQYQIIPVAYLIGADEPFLGAPQEFSVVAPAIEEIVISGDESGEGRTFGSSEGITASVRFSEYRSLEQLREEVSSQYRLRFTRRRLGSLEVQHQAMEQSNWEIGPLPTGRHGITVELQFANRTIAQRSAEFSVTEGLQAIISGLGASYEGGDSVSFEVGFSGATSEDVQLALFIDGQPLLFGPDDEVTLAEIDEEDGFYEGEFEVTTSAIPVGAHSLHAEVTSSGVTAITTPQSVTIESSEEPGEASLTLVERPANTPLEGGVAVIYAAAVGRNEDQELVPGSIEWQLDGVTLESGEGVSIEVGVSRSELTLTLDQTGDYTLTASLPDSGLSVSADFSVYAAAEDRAFVSDGALERRLPGGGWESLETLAVLYDGDVIRGSGQVYFPGSEAYQQVETGGCYEVGESGISLLGYSVSGKVVDSGGSGVSGALLVLGDLTEGKEFSAWTQGDGSFSIDWVPEGDYRVSAVVGQEAVQLAPQVSIKGSTSLGDLELPEDTLTVTEVLPQGQGVPTTTSAVTVRFNMPVPTEVESDLTIVPSAELQLGDWSWAEDRQSVEIPIVSTLTPETDYTLTVALEKDDGSKEFTEWRFATESHSLALESWEVRLGAGLQPFLQVIFRVKNESAAAPVSSGRIRITTLPLPLPTTEAEPNALQQTQGEFSAPQEIASKVLSPIAPGSIGTAVVSLPAGMLGTEAWISLVVGGEVVQVLPIMLLPTVVNEQR